jgi:hypothetical protein
MFTVSTVSSRGVPAVAVAAWLAASAQLVSATPLRSPDSESAPMTSASCDPSVQRELRESLTEDVDQPLTVGFRHGRSEVAVSLVADVPQTPGTNPDSALPGLAPPTYVSARLHVPRTADQIYSEFGILAVPASGTNERGQLWNLLVASSGL